MRKIAIIPALLTLGNGVCGFVSIAMASKIMPLDHVAAAARDAVVVDNELYFRLAGWFIIAAMVFDMLDGYVARLSKTASKFGGELDSLCDAVSFGVAPAFLLLKMGPGWERVMLHQIVAGIAGLYMVCTILRLARFNVDNSPDPAAHKRFRGLPSPGAAGCMASLAVLRGEFPAKLAEQWRYGELVANRELVQGIVEMVAPLGAVVVALLMVSVVPFPHVTKHILRGRRHVWHLIQLLLAIFLIVLVRELALVAVFWGYALGVPCCYAVLKHLARRSPPVSVEDKLAC
ncbi:MAG: CDP-diacylglycerol--serine O-phosphatidyltransferase [Gemmataceae bacterium]|nr:CDP-diacylglycerol--serine O-phosphatidyltransferase [Gemmataceae bacterium]